MCYGLRGWVSKQLTDGVVGFYISPTQHLTNSAELLWGAGLDISPTQRLTNSPT
jgi:hypothetical protein